MKKLQLRKIIRESIGELLNEQASCYTGGFTNPYLDQSTVGSSVIEREITLTPAHYYGGCGPNHHWGYSAHNITIDGATPQPGDSFYFPGYANFLNSGIVDCCNNDCPQQVFRIRMVKDPTPNIPTMNWNSAVGGTVPNPTHPTYQNWLSANPNSNCTSTATCMEIQATPCTGSNMTSNAMWDCATIAGQVPDTSYVGTSVFVNNTDYEITAIVPSTSSPWGTQDFPVGSPCSTPCDTSTSSPCAIQWFQNPNATWAANWINNRDCSNYTWPSIHLENQANTIMAGAPNPTTSTYNNASDIWAAGNASGLPQQQRNQFIAKMAKAKYAQCQKQACNC